MLNLEQLKKDYEGKEFKLVNLDNHLLNDLNLKEQYGMFSSNIMEVLYENNFVYVTDNENNEGYKVEVEVVENNEDNPTEIIAKVTNIEKW